MPAPANMLKRRLNSGEVLHGCWIGLANAYCAEIAATTGFDWLVIDGEHAPNGVPAMSAQLAAIAAGPAHAAVRVVDHSSAGIKQALDIGAQTIVVPMVETAEQAGQIVRAALYPPKGIRGVGAGQARASRFGAIPDYLTTANDEICIFVQIESRAGLDSSGRNPCNRKCRRCVYRAR